MTLPEINFTITTTVETNELKGNLKTSYAPFYNLRTDDGLTNLRLLTEDAGIDITKPLEIETEPSYDGSVNMIINDNVNPSKIVNSRFYLTSSTEFEVADRKGNIDTNIYSEDEFKQEAGLIKTVDKVIKLDYLGLGNGGKLPVGNYTFYFKLADADGNETDFISESGKVICHIGEINDPFSIRGGILNEDSGKIVKFKLKNLDLAYNFIKVYYTRNTSSEDETPIVETYVINDKFKITPDDLENSTIITITGFESVEKIDNSEINLQYAYFDAVKTQTNVQNISFAGNITNDYEVFKELEDLSLYITPEITNEETIGHLDSNFNETIFPVNGWEYYNTRNVYDKLGYWNNEVYRIGIVYVMNNYTLSPVFNIRGINELTDTSIALSDPSNEAFMEKISYDNNYAIKDNLTHNSKGVFRIKSTKNIFNGAELIKPLGIKFNIPSKVITGLNEDLYVRKGLKDLTKGFFFVRQQRIPDILTQGVTISTVPTVGVPCLFSTALKNNYVGGKGHILESFLYPHTNNLTKNHGYLTPKWVKADIGAKPRIGSSFFQLPSAISVKNNALLCPDATLRSSLYNNFFNGSKFKLEKVPVKSNNTTSDDNFLFKQISDSVFSLGDLVPFTLEGSSLNSVSSELTLVEPGVDIIGNGTSKFKSRCGDANIAWQTTNPVYDVNNPQSDGTEDEFSDNCFQLRGEFNTFIGSSEELQRGAYYNIYQKNFNETDWQNNFKVRYNDSSSYQAISDRFEWTDVVSNKTKAIYRGDCYICTYAHRMNWNFIDPELPTNSIINDNANWYKNYKVKVGNRITVATGGTNISYDENDDITNAPSEQIKVSYKKVLPLFAYAGLREGSALNLTKDRDVTTWKLRTPDHKYFKEDSERNGTFGSDKINRPDVNAVDLGHWVVFKVCSNINLSMRDIDSSHPAEEALHKVKRGFYPYNPPSPFYKLPESSVINSGISKTLSDKYYFDIPDVPFIKTNFSTRINYSNVMQETFKNGGRVFMKTNFQDYTMEYGELVKLVEWFGTLIAVMEHGILQIPINERAMLKNATGDDIYLNAEKVLPKNPHVLSSTFGTIWADSVVKTNRFIYGIDTVGKKIWRITRDAKGVSGFEIISDLKVQKFLNDNIKFHNADKNAVIGETFVKSHFNAFKQDVMFVLKDNSNNIEWNLCWNELLDKWVTRYTWIPEFSENINNIFYTFAKDKSLNASQNFKIWKHGYAGNKEEMSVLSPTLWFNDSDNQKFEFEFVVIGQQGVQKIWNNLKLISNKAEPDSFEYEIVGEGYDWHDYKDIIVGLNDPTLSTVSSDLILPSGSNLVSGLTTYPSTETLTEDKLKTRYKEFLIGSGLKKLPFIQIKTLSVNNTILKDLTIKQNNKTKDNLIISAQKGADLKTFGRLKGNMMYAEDAWDVQIQPINFKYAYVKNNTLLFANNTEMKIRDKYVKVRVRYKGNKMAIITAIKTFFTISYT